MTEIKMPVDQITSVAFGTKTLDALFVTTAGMDTVSPQTFPAGYLFKVTNLGVHGIKMTKFSATK